MVLQDLKETQVLTAQMVQLVFQDQKVIKEILVILDLPVLMVQQV